MDQIILEYQNKVKELIEKSSYFNYASLGRQCFLRNELCDYDLYEINYTKIYNANNSNKEYVQPEQGTGEELSRILSLEFKKEIWGIVVKKIGLDAFFWEKHNHFMSSLEVCLQSLRLIGLDMHYMMNDELNLRIKNEVIPKFISSPHGYYRENLSTFIRLGFYLDDEIMHETTIFPDSILYNQNEENKKILFHYKLNTELQDKSTSNIKYKI